MRVPDAGSEPGSGAEHFEFTLFVSGASELSSRAVAGANQLCDAHVGGRYTLAVVDVHEDPEAVSTEGVLATPTLVKHRPLPSGRFVGDLSHTSQAVLALGLPAAGVADAGPRG